MKRIRNIFSKRKCPPIAGPGGALASRYRAFKTFLAHNQAALTVLADMEQLYYEGRPFSLTEVRILYEALLESVMGIIYTLEQLSGKPFAPLVAIVEKIDQDLFANFNPKCSITTDLPVLPLEEITPELKPMVGAKAGNLASIANHLAVPVPPGFAVTVSAFEAFLQENRLPAMIREELDLNAPGDSAAIAKTSARIRDAVLRADVPPAVAQAIGEAYRDLEKKTRLGVRMAMRSSAAGEDTEATFAGQYETVLNVTEGNLLDAYKHVLASKYSARAIAYRVHHGLDDRETPMCVLGIAMIDAKASGVLYSADPASPGSRQIRINSLWGVGEQLVDGSAAPDVFLLDKADLRIRERHVSRKGLRLSSLHGGGTVLEPVPEDLQLEPSLDDGTIARLARYGLLLEEFFNGPQDIEWAIDAAGSLFILQSRPLYLPEAGPQAGTPRHFTENPVLFSGGTSASRGVAAGALFILDEKTDLNTVPDDAILVAKTASPELARTIGRIRGIITDVGSITSHMASVAREFGIPAVVNAGNATAQLPPGEVVTLEADTATIYRGVVGELLGEMRPARKLIFDSPIHRRMRTILDRISPLHLTDPSSPSFSPEGCTTFHDIIRYTHEQAVKEMFGISVEPGAAKASVRLVSSLPLDLWVIDIGGGLKKGLTTCDTIVPDHIESAPMKALWSGFAHPGVNWAGTMNIDSGTLSGILAVSAVSELGAAPPSESYAVLSKDYFNLSIRFAYHFATIDALCGRNSSQNYVSLQFTGGAGNYYGRSLRVRFIGTVLEKLGFQVKMKGDLLEASISRYDCRSLANKLDLLGRLLASSRLLDMTLSDQEQISRAADAFFNGEYDLLLKRDEGGITGFYLHGGSWRMVDDEGRRLILQDGSRWGRRISSEVTGLIGKMIGRAYYELLDTMEAYFYFPLAIVKDVRISTGSVTVRIKPVSGKVDQAGGIAFGMRTIENYFVLRTNALEGNVSLFEYINGRRVLLAGVRARIETGQWHELRVEIRDHAITGSLNGEPIIRHRSEDPVTGFIGLWTKADSVVYFAQFTVADEKGTRSIVA